MKAIRTPNRTCTPYSCRYPSPRRCCTCPDSAQQGTSSSTCKSLSSMHTVCTVRVCSRCTYRPGGTCSCSHLSRPEQTSAQQGRPCTTLNRRRRIQPGTGPCRTYCSTCRNLTWFRSACTCRACRWPCRLRASSCSRRATLYKFRRPGRARSDPSGTTGSWRCRHRRRCHPCACQRGSCSSCCCWSSSTDRARSDSCLCIR